MIDNSKTSYFMVLDPKKVARPGAPVPQVIFFLYWGDDGTPIIEIRTEKLPEDHKGPLVRIYLNDALLHENPLWKSMPDDTEEDEVAPISFDLVTRHVFSNGEECPECGYEPCVYGALL
jgi:hypothetical protein